MKYSTYGRLWSGCGHVHKLREDAERCLVRHTNSRLRFGPPTDRVIVFIGPDGYFYADDKFSEVIKDYKGNPVKITG